VITVPIEPVAAVVAGEQQCGDQYRLHGCLSFDIFSYMSENDLNYISAMNVVIIIASAAVLFALLVYFSTSNSGLSSPAQEHLA
jgi:hypothetical protein